MRRERHDESRDERSENPDRLCPECGLPLAVDGGCLVDHQKDRDDEDEVS